MAVRRGRLVRDCSFCNREVGQKEMRHAMRGKFVYYKSYRMDIGEPSFRRHFFACPDCTTEVAKLFQQLDKRGEQDD